MVAFETTLILVINVKNWKSQSCVLEIASTAKIWKSEIAIRTHVVLIFDPKCVR
jgi:hypothetical protein